MKLRVKGKDMEIVFRYLLFLLLGFMIGSLNSVFHYHATIHTSSGSTTMQQHSARSGSRALRPRQAGPVTQLTYAQLADAGRLYVATGANAAYFGGLMNLVGSLRYWCPECQVLVFNLGLSAEQVSTARSWCNTTVLWAGGVPGDAHLKEPHKYAWKPLAILEAVNTYKRVLWLDAGSTVTTPLRTTVWPLQLKDGHFFVQGQDNDMVPWCHDLTWQYFKLDKDKFRGKPSYSGNTVGFVYGSPGYHKLLLPWVECAKVEACMAPPGTSTGNHRFDQSVLSIITYTAGLNVTEHTELLLAAPVECYKPHARAVWTSRQGCTCYQRFSGGCDVKVPNESLPPYPKLRVAAQTWADEAAKIQVE